MPYKDPERKREWERAHRQRRSEAKRAWEQAHRQERAERMRALRHSVATSSDAQGEEKERSTWPFWITVAAMMAAPLLILFFQTPSDGPPPA